MRIKIITVVDITQTNANRSGDTKSRNQQANYNTLQQTVGLRVNPIPMTCESKVGVVDDFGFGSLISGKQRYWEYLFEHEVPEGLTLESLESDFDLVPVITGLDETAVINNSAFRTKDKAERNILFKFVDKDLYE